MNITWKKKIIINFPFTAAIVATLQVCNISTLLPPQVIVLPPQLTGCTITGLNKNATIVSLYWEKLYCPHGKPRYLSTIPLKDFHLFKIVESIISFCLKKFSDLAILIRWESFSRMVDHVTCPPWKPYNFSFLSMFWVFVVSLGVYL